MANGRRGQNEGSIFRRKDGRWCGQIDLGWKDGKRQRRLIYASSRAGVRELMTKGLRERDMGILPAAGKIPTVAGHLGRWLNTTKVGARIRTYERYEGIVRKHLLPSVGRLKLDKLTPAHVQTLLDQKLSEGLAPRSVRGIKIVLHAALRQAVRWQLIARNVAEFAVGPKVQNREMKVFTPEEARIFLGASRGEPLKALYVLALSTGLRRGELLALKWEDLDFDEGTLRVRRALSRSCTQGIVISEPKTAHGRRVVRLSQGIVGILKAHRKQQFEQRLSVGPRWQDCGYVFTTSIGTSIDPRHLSDDFARVTAKSGLRKIRFHDLRHSSATIALSQGVHPKIVSEMLGHSRISLTLDVYSHSLPTLQSEAADKIASALIGSAS
ncbi:MAG: site-specific integrase [Deltaproteobacteria bacterium]|nr:site-specific integrase [Deltaproteobacteria bacterium]